MILAAGRSSRMGSPKGLLGYRGASFIDRLVGAFREGGCQLVIVVAGHQDDPGHAGVGEAALARGAILAINPDVESQQIDSLRVALRRIPAGVAGVIATPVDAPGATAAVVRALIGAIHRGARIAVPTYLGKRGHPIAFAAAALPELLESDLPEGMRSMLRRYGGITAEVPVNDRCVLFDIDTPEDLARLEDEAE